MKYVVRNTVTNEEYDMSEFKITKRKDFGDEFKNITLSDIIRYKNDDEVDSNNKTKADRVETYLQRYLFATGQMMSNHRIKLNGAWVNAELFELAQDNGFEKEVVALISNTSTNYNTIKNKRNGRKVARNWTELYEFLKINPRKKKKFRKFLTDNDIVRQSGNVTEKLKDIVSMYVNPKYYRRYSHVGKDSIVAFRDYTLKDIHEYSKYWLYITGAILEESLYNYKHKEFTEDINNDI